MMERFRTYVAEKKSVIEIDIDHRDSERFGEKAISKVLKKHKLGKPTGASDKSTYWKVKDMAHAEAVERDLIKIGVHPTIFVDGAA